MTQDQLRNLCKFYGQQYFYEDEETQELAERLSTFEQHVCDMLLDRELQQGETPREVFDDYVGSMIGKWCPYECNELWELYTSK